MLIQWLFLFYRIFVNRSLHLENIKFYGFDMDYTLAGNVYYVKYVDIEVRAVVFLTLIRD